MISQVPLDRFGNVKRFTGRHNSSERRRSAKNYLPQSERFATTAARTPTRSRRISFAFLKSAFADGAELETPILTGSAVEGFVATLNVTV